MQALNMSATVITVSSEASEGQMLTPSHHSVSDAPVDLDLDLDVEMQCSCV